MVAAVLVSGMGITGGFGAGLQRSIYDGDTLCSSWWVLTW